MTGRVNACLVNLSRLAGTLGKRVPEDVHNNFPLGYATDVNEFGRMLHHLGEKKFIEMGAGSYELTVSGWAFVETLQQTTRTSKQAFIAMDFSNEFDELRENGIVPAIAGSNFDAFCLKGLEHNDHIDDRMVLEIRKSRFVVAEVSTANANVYFEAGLALGAGIPVIWLCSDSEKHIRKFDVEHFNHIFYKDSRSLKERLQTRIQATMGGP